MLFRKPASRTKSGGFGAPVALLFLAFAATGSGQVEKVIMDTDCAVFNDDGAALVMLLERPEKVNLLGLTLVPGNLWPGEGAGYMFHVLDLLNKPAVPLFLGARAPLVHTRGMAEKENKEWGPVEYMGAFVKDETPAKRAIEHRMSRRPAIDHLVETLDQAESPVTILAIGPMTNLAILLRLRPDLAKKIRRLVFMGGSVHEKNGDGRAAEFNFWFDPEAAQVVLRSAIPQKVMFGLDICNRAQLDKAHYDQIVSAKTPITELFREDMGKRFAKNPDAKANLWDCLAAGYLIDPAFVVKQERAYLDVDTTFGKNYGAVTPLDRTLAPAATAVDVMLDLNFERFFELYKGLLTKTP